MDWEKRIEKLNENVFRESEEYVKGIRKIYDFEVNKIQDKIYNHLTKLQAEAGGISLFEAKKMLNDKELSLFKMDLDEFMKKSKGSITPEIERELDIISHRVRISRLQAMELELKKTVANLMSKEDKGLFNHLGKTYEKRYYNELYELHRIVGYSNFQSIDKGTLKTILKTPWTSDGNEFSNRIWGRGNKLVNSLKDNLTRDIIRGTSPDESIKNIAKEFETSKYNAVRLVMTETAAINSKAVQDSYKKLGVEKYEIVATLDLKTSQICRDMDGRVFDYKDYKIGITAPPFHPNCYDKETEVLTNVGWKYFKDLNNEDLLFTLNPDTKIPEWQEPINLIKYKYKGKMIKYLSDRFDLVVTPNHRMLTQNMDSSVKDKSYKFKKACEIGTQSKNRIPCGINWIGESKNFIELAGKKIDIKTYLKFMAYWLSDGSVSKNKGLYRIKIAQLDNDWMWNELENLPFKKYKCKESILVENNELGKELVKFGKCSEKFIPDAIKYLDKKLITFFLNEYVKCDGTIKKGKFWKGYHFKDSASFFTSSNQLAADLGELILKAGGRPSYKLNRCAGNKIEFSNGVYEINYDIWTIHWNKQVYSWICYMNVDDSFYYDDFVYCAEVAKYNTLYVRRNGKCCWSGNCRTTTVPYFDDIDDETRMMRNPETGKSERIEKLSYGEWYEKYVDVSNEKEYTNSKQTFEKVQDKFYNYLSKEEVEELNLSNASEEEISSIYKNEQGGYIQTANSMDINYILRNFGVDKLNSYDKETYDNLLSVVSKNILSTNVKLDRYVDGEFIEFMLNMELGFEKEDYYNAVREIKLKKLGEIIHEKGFISASWNSKHNIFKDREVKLVLLVPKGTCAYLTNNVIESEVILAPSKLKVIDCKIINSKERDLQIELILEVINGNV